MKWFKHMTDAHNDEKLDALFDEFGCEGYGAYWRILEVLAKQLDEDGVTSRKFSNKFWRKLTGFSLGKFHKLVTFCGNNKLLCSEIDEKTITIDCPKLLHIKDNHTKNSIAKAKKTCKQLASDLPLELELEEELELDQIKTSKKVLCDDLPPDNFAGQFGDHHKELLDLWCEGRKSVGLPASRIGGNASGATLLQNAITKGDITIEDARKAVTNIAANKEYGKWSIDNVFKKFDMALANDTNFSKKKTPDCLANRTTQKPKEKKYKGVSK